MCRPANLNVAMHSGRAAMLAVALALTVQPPLQAQAMPNWAKGATAQQVSTFNAARAGLQKRLRLSNSMLDSIARIVGKDYKSGKFLDLLQDLKDRAELARKLQDDMAAMRGSVRMLPPGAIRSDADRLLADSRADLDAGRLELAEAKLAQLAALRWDRSGADLALWMQSVLAQSDVVRIRRGADAAVDVIGTARAGLLADTTRTDTQLLLKQVDVYLTEEGRRGTRAPLDKALALIADGLSRLDPVRNPLEFGQVQLIYADVLYELARWDQTVWPKAAVALSAARAGIHVSDGDAYLKLLQSEIEHHHIAGQTDAVLKDADELIGLARSNRDDVMLAEGLHGRALAESDFARSLDNGNLAKASWYEASIRDNLESIAAAARIGRTTSGTRVNLITVRIGLALCCVKQADQLPTVEQAVAEMTRAEDFWSRSEDPASWYHIQTIIGSSYRSLAALRYQGARLTRDKAAITKALQEMRLAKQYYVNGSQFMTALNIGAFGEDKVAKDMADVDASIQTYQQALSMLD